MRISYLLEILSSNISEETKLKTFKDFVNQSKTPKDIKELLEAADIITKLSAVLTDDSLARQVVFDLLTKYGTLRYPERKDQ